MYCSRIALNSSWPAVSRTVNNAIISRHLYIKNKQYLKNLTVKPRSYTVDDALLLIRIFDSWIIIRHKIRLKEQVNSRGVASPNPGGGPTSGEKVPIFYIPKNTPKIGKGGKTLRKVYIFRSFLAKTSKILLKNRNFCTWVFDKRHRFCPFFFNLSVLKHSYMPKFIEIV